VNENFASVKERYEFAVISFCIFWFYYFTQHISPIVTKMADFKRSDIRSKAISNLSLQKDRNMMRETTSRT